MDDKEIMKKYGITKGIGITIFIQMLLISAALVITIIGLTQISDTRRIIIYVGQAIASVLVFCLGIFRFKARNRKMLKIVINAYALLEALRAALLNTNGIDPLISYICRFLLAVLACNCVLVAERLDKRSGEKIAVGMVVLELALYIVFLIGFPGVTYGRLNRILPFVGILIAGSIALLQKAKNMQLGISKE